MTKIQIKHRFTDSVLFECDAPDDLDSGLHTRYALEKATQAGANLVGANLARAYLVGANLVGANLVGANLDGANLVGANLARAYLARANLDGANLVGAYLARANLDGANLDGAKLIGERPVFQIGPIGSRCAYFVAYLTDKGIKLLAGCFFGSLDEFVAKLSEEHGDNEHAIEYRAALELIKAHSEIWTPKEG